jgi:hypothetical protein
MRKLVSITLLTALAVLFFQGCEKKADPPAVPPVESMLIDFSEFTGVKKSAFMTGEEKGMFAVENGNWLAASSTANFWNTIVSVTLGVPVAAFTMTIQEAPVYIDDNTWQWEYSVEAVGTSYNARLTGQILTNSVKWRMYIEKTGANPYEEFEWFNGTTALDGKSGQWILNLSNQFQEPILQIDWEKEGNKVGSVKYTYIRVLNDNRQADPFIGSYIGYGLSDPAAGTLNAFYDVYFWNPSLAKFMDVDIEWNTTDHNGRIKAPDYFTDSNWHCWDGNGNDTTCPAQ